MEERSCDKKTFNRNASNETMWRPPKAFMSYQEVRAQPKHTVKLEVWRNVDNSWLI